MVIQTVNSMAVGRIQSRYGPVSSADSDGLIRQPKVKRIGMILAASPDICWFPIEDTLNETRVIRYFFRLDKACVETIVESISAFGTVFFREKCDFAPVKFRRIVMQTSVDDAVVESGLPYRKMHRSIINFRRIGKYQRCHPFTWRQLHVVRYRAMRELVETANETDRVLGRVRKFTVRRFDATVNSCQQAALTVRDL